ncbi:MAG: nitroreductase family deazaflavin-dependent oxidoreductase, partial [Chloroflexi bacterium]|nr:nitroreductase family deazaflavin-dependent oxidoreductase [Chloroflexota bacterium]
MGTPRKNQFDAHTLGVLTATDEIDVETHPASGRSRRTTIWIVVEGGNVYVRAVRGVGGRWYREVRADAAPAVIAEGRRYPVHAVPVQDEAEISRVTEAYLRKY